MGAALVFATLLLGHIRVETPAHRVKTRVETVAVLAKLEPGEPLTFEKLTRAERELRNTNLFSDVHVRVLMSPEDAARLMYFDSGTAYADIAISFQEKRTWYAFPFGSFSPQNLSFGAVFADVNLAGRANTLFAAGQWGDKTKQVFALYRDPALFDSRFAGADVSSLLRDDHIPIYVNRT